ncbi:hypothetical protein ASPWEDRAFT_494153 [Aspergillus wentii DTO 134E9]|uniref:DUF202 domain-containing protein n=1 Tax=Aspergillus wentii DTO 134E9 TaxID=1073089 RepID=A0A1L9RJQ2_ASPWE|nr:uncharacterized protein ASPWEDRAFT_494153 [Aspergillus wentii DTO 134E9]KAI9931900.1 hypothetical protein MW887_009401 [Aspergillus wentii]OJJ35145.1 hypothetical protein ASPWEDRAFT_494153 [Aspergillus wentii DTO 134E9]
MDSSDLVEPSRLDPTHARKDTSSHRSSTGLGRTSPSSSTRRQSASPQNYMQPSYGQDQANPVNEGTPIVRDDAESRRRNYQSTENLRNRQSGDSQAKSSTQPEEGEGHNNQNNDSRSSREPQSSWYKRIADRYGSLELENKGSVARDHLALERTFLAWLRTSLAFASIGIAVTQLFRLNSSSATTNPRSFEDSSQSFPPLLESPYYDVSAAQITVNGQRLRSIGKPLGTTFIGVALVILIVGFHRYFESQYWIVRGKFPASRGSVALISIIASALIIAAFVVILAISPGAIEK